MRLLRHCVPRNDRKGRNSKVSSRDLQQNVPVQRRENPVEIVVVLHEVMVQVSEEMRGDPAGRLGRRDDVEPSVVEGDAGNRQKP